MSAYFVGGPQKLSPLCKCDVPSRRLMSKTPSNPDRWFFTCSKNTCKMFVWESDVGTVLTVQGPRCRCGQPSVQRYDETASLVWVCYCFVLHLILVISLSPLNLRFGPITLYKKDQYIPKHQTWKKCLKFYIFPQNYWFIHWFI